MGQMGQMGGQQRMPTSNYNNPAQMNHMQQRYIDIIRSLSVTGKDKKKSLMTLIHFGSNIWGLNYPTKKTTNHYRHEPVLKAEVT